MPPACKRGREQTLCRTEGAYPYNGTVRGSLGIVGKAPDVVQSGSGPCRYGLAAARVPAKRWATRADVLACVAVAKAEIEARACERLTLRQIAASAGLSPFHLQRLFKSVYRTTPHAYLTSRRLDIARRLLREEGVTVAEACLEVGFSSPASFTRLYRRRFGEPPGEARRRPAIPPEAPKRSSP